jgi:O-acetyl-ADP-ribose deacetylase (regulator of RNase III)
MNFREAEDNMGKLVKLKGVRVEVISARHKICHYLRSLQGLALPCIAAGCYGCSQENQHQKQGFHKDLNFIN